MPYAGPSDAASTATATRLHSHRRTRSSFSEEHGPGAFAPLGQLPRLNKKAVFHINDNDDDNANDDERPSYPTYTSPYSPINSLRLSMNAGKFSPSIDPPPRIDIPPFEPSVAVPFPTSSPASPSLRSSPFVSFSSSRSSSDLSSPSLSRSSSIILSNGKPLKSSLKSSSSSPAISNLPIKHIRTQSAPSTPSSNKNVHFAEKDSGLETIRVFNRTGKPASLSKPPGEETETETEAESSSYPFPVLSSTPIASTASAILLHEIDPSVERTNPIPKVNPSPYANVFLETLALPRTRPPTLRGTILTRNMAFEKVVAVRFTLDDWQTTSEVMCKHVVSLPGLPPPFPRARTMGDVAGNIAAGQPIEDNQKDLGGPAWDRFSFTIRLEDYEAKLGERTLFLVVRYNPGTGGEWWDNNDGANYRVGFRRAAASPLPSPAIGVTHSQQRTFNAPSTLKTTPTTSALGSPFTPPTRQLAPPLAPQLTRSMSSPFPTLSSSFTREQKERTGEKGIGSAYLSKKLLLSNYVAPSAQASSSSMVTPPITPPGTIRLQNASLPVDVKPTADEPKEQRVQNAEEVVTPTHPALTYRSSSKAPSPPRRASPPLSAPTSRNRPSSPTANSPPALSPLSSIPGPSVSTLSAQLKAFGPSSYGFGFDGGSTMGYSRPQLLSPPRSKEGSPASSGTASPRRDGSPEPIGTPTLGLEVAPAGSSLTEGTQDAASVASFLNNANSRVDTSDPSYAALLRQWCFAQSSPPAPPVSAPQGSSNPNPRSSTGLGVGVMKSGETTPKVGFGAGSGYGFPGFNFGLPDAGMVGAHMG